MKEKNWPKEKVIYLNKVEKQMVLSPSVLIVSSFFFLLSQNIFQVQLLQSWSP